MMSPAPVFFIFEYGLVMGGDYDSIIVSNTIAHTHCEEIES